MGGLNINGVCVCVYSEFKMGTAVEDQQLSCLWQGSHILSLSLSGYINYLDVNNPATPLRILKVRSSYLFFQSFTLSLTGSEH